MTGIDFEKYDKLDDRAILQEADRYRGFSDSEVHGALREILIAYLNARSTERLVRLTVWIRNLTLAIVGLTVVSVVLFCVQWACTRGK
ncbi:MAG: hypothetical protein AAB152_05660 [Candidatus Coatesbacteria bacterium]